MKLAMREAHAELVSREFMIRLTDMSTEDQQFIMNALFQHFYPWRIVIKEDSITTPIRLVVDPTCTGLNLTLAKGENRLGQIFYIIFRNRSKPYAWTTDESKLYNQLYLEKLAWLFSLFLYHDSLDSKVAPETWVMLGAWFGKTPTGAKADYALVK